MGRALKEELGQFLEPKKGIAESGIIVAGSFPSQRSALVSSTRFWLLASAAARALMKWQGYFSM